MKILSLSVLVGLMLWLQACSSGSPPASEASANAPLDIQEMLQREAEALESQELKSADQRIQAAVPARLIGSVVLDEGVYAMELDIGSDGSISCWIYADGLHLATGLSELSNAMLGESSLLGEVQAKQIVAVQAGAIARHPYLGVRWLYRGLQEGRAAVGELGLLTASKNPYGVACIQNELGFNETFQRVFTELVSSLAPPDSTVPYYAEISTVSVKGMTVGVQIQEFTRDTDGDTMISTTVSMALPTSPTDLLSSDNYDIQYSTEGGELINQWHQSLEGGAVSTALRLDPDPDGDYGWSVSGVFQQKEIAADIEAGALPSLLGQMRALQNLLADGQIGQQIYFPTWAPGADPTHLMDSRTQLLEKLDESRNRVGVQIGPMQMTGVADRTGSMETAEMNIGPLSLQMERVYQLGDL